MSTGRNFDLKLEQYKLGELSPEEMKEVESNPEYKEYLDYIDSSNSEFFNKFSIDELIDNAKAEAKKSNIIKFPTKVISAITAVAACFILTLNILPGVLKNQNEEIIYLKGRTKINVYKKSGDSVVKLHNLDRVKEDDQLQITYTTKEPYGIIFSIDGLGNITYHYPEGLYSSRSLDIGKEIILPNSYTLDNAPHFEKFYLITSKKGFDFSLVEESIIEIEINSGIITDDLFLPEEYTIKTLMLIKE